jgi:uncharacterized protein YciI
MPTFAVRTAKGPNWDHGREIREQLGWDEHAAFADGLVGQGVIVLGGPISSDDQEDLALILVEAADEEDVRSIFEKDPWTANQVFSIKEVRSWLLWLDSRRSRSDRG